jgi:hypothetical protein
MSLDIETYVPSVNDSQIPLWLSRMKELGMICEIHPKFSFPKQSGFLPFKLQIHDSAHQELNGVDFLTGFEYYISDFDFDVELKEFQEFQEEEGTLPKRGMLSRLLGKKRPQIYATPELDELLKRCQTRLTFRWGSADLFELRMATVSSAVLAEITTGISSYPAEGIWYDRNTAAVDAVSEARDYENSIKDVKVPSIRRLVVAVRC